MGIISTPIMIIMTGPPVIFQQIALFFTPIMGALVALSVFIPI
ncbi:MAG: hypothetical protein WCE81_03740 [Halobacteriota archaeon]